MSNLPRRRIEPLEPPPDSFDRVLTSARRRRRRHALAAASSTLVVVLVAAGSFALGSSLNGTQRFDDAGIGKSDSTPTVLPSPQVSATHSKRPSPHTLAPATAARPDTPKAISWLRGRAVDPNGRPIAGLFVLPGDSGHATFSSSGVVGARTDSKGNFTIACPRAPVLLATWQLDTELPALSTGGLYAATFVGVAKGSTEPVVPACGKKRVTTTLGFGGSVTGTVHVLGDCAKGTTFPLSLWLNGDRDETVQLGGLQDGDAFSFRGLPAGTHTLGTRPTKVSITVRSGDSAEQDATFTCGILPTETPSPSLSPTPTSSPSPSGSTSPPVTPSPTPTPTVS